MTRGNRWLMQTVSIFFTLLAVGILLTSFSLFVTAPLGENVWGDLLCGFGFGVLAGMFLTWVFKAHEQEGLVSSFAFDQFEDQNAIVAEGTGNGYSVVVGWNIANLNLMITNEVGRTYRLTSYPGFLSSRWVLERELARAKQATRQPEPIFEGGDPGWETRETDERGEQKAA